MTYDPPLSLSFRSLIKNGKFFTLDGEKEVNAPYYSKFITSTDDLTAIEVNYVLIKYSGYNRYLGELTILIEKMKI